MTDKLIVKYLDPNTKKYENATVADVGDLSKLKTSIKTDLVSAINAITSGEINIPDDMQEVINNINDRIDGIEQNGLNENQINDINTIVNNIKTELDKAIKDMQDDVDLAQKEVADLIVKIDNDLASVEDDYNAKVEAIQGDLNSAKESIIKTKQDLNDTKEHLSNVDLNYTHVIESIDTVNGELGRKVDQTKFDLMDSVVQQNTTDIKQNSKDIKASAKQSDLDLTNGRVSDAEAAIQVNADAIGSKVSYEEMQDELDEIGKYGKNLLRNTRTWRDWETNDALKAYTTINEYRHCKIVEIKDRNYYFEYTLEDELEVGETYSASINFKSNIDDPLVSVKFYEGKNSYVLDQVYEDVSSINGWKRMYVAFVATEKTPKVSFRFTYIPNEGTGYLSAGKIEKGKKASPWEANSEDDNIAILEANSEIKQTAQRITQAVERIEKTEDNITKTNTRIDQTDETLGLQAQKITEIDGNVSQNKADIKIANDSIKSKVSQTDVDKSIADINIDNKNRILNSDFSLDWENWNEKNSAFQIKTINGIKFASISRTGLSADNIASVASDKFIVRNGEKLIFSFGLIVDDLTKYDIQKPIVLELFDINDVRVDFKTFSISDLDGVLRSGVLTRLNGVYQVNREDVAKGRIKLTLNRNGSVNYSQIMLQSGDIKSTDWSQAPEDSQKIRAKLETSIDQTAEAITLKADKSDMNKLTGDIDNMSAELKIASDSIASLVTKTDDQGTKISKLEQTAERLSSTIAETNTTVSDVKDEVDNIKNNVTYKVELISNNGLTFKNGVIQTTIKAIVYNGKKDVTDSIDANRFVWTKVNADGTFDDVWNQVNASGKKEVPVTKEDVFKRATFFCEITE